MCFVKSIVEFASEGLEEARVKAGEDAAACLSHGNRLLAAGP
jgi:hypothetical protein